MMPDEGLGAAMAESAIREVTHPQYYFWGAPGPVLCPDCGFHVSVPLETFDHARGTAVAECVIAPCERYGKKFELQAHKFPARLL